MSTETQRTYIRDLAINKLKEFKEFKELLLSKGIITEGTDTANVTTMAELLNRLSDEQASEVITALIERSEPVRDDRYSDKRVKQVIELLDEIKETIADWNFS